MVEEYKISEALRAEIDYSISIVKDPLIRAKEILSERIDEPYFADLLNEVKLCVLFRRARESSKLLENVIESVPEIRDLGKESK